jgi:hypothetical protein
MNSLRKRSIFFACPDPYRNQDTQNFAFPGGGRARRPWPSAAGLRLAGRWQETAPGADTQDTQEREDTQTEKFHSTDSAPCEILWADWRTA